MPKYYIKQKRSDSQCQCPNNAFWQLDFCLFSRNSHK